MTGAYLDHAATSPLRPEAFDAMVPFLTEHFGNPSGSHAVARRARLAVDEARDELAAALGCSPGEVVFTAGGTEADNLGVLGAVGRHGGTAVCSAVEHHAVLHAVESVGGAVVGVDGTGTVDLDALAAAVDQRTAVVSVMLANNEVGTVQPIADVVARVKARNPRTLVHTDAVHAFPWLDVAGLAAGADLVSVSAHKFGGPKGVGALVVRGAAAILPRTFGGGQERDRRSGTHDVAGIVGMAAAASVTVARRASAVAAAGARRDRLVDEILTRVPGIRETVPRHRKVAGNAHLLVPRVESEALLVVLDELGVCASAGSACASGAIEPSHVLLAMGHDRATASGALRLTLGPETTDDEIDLALKVVPDAVARVRGS